MKGIVYFVDVVCSWAVLSLSCHSTLNVIGCG